MDQIAQAKIEALAGAGLMTTPVWVILLQDASLVFSAIASLCGAILGIHAVWRLWKSRRA